MRFRLALLALVLASPVALAAWSSVGDTQGEPSTTYDSPGYMFFAPDTSASDVRVYYHAFLSPVGTGGQQHVGRFFAWFGAWKDCNADGFIGDGATAQETYPAVLLVMTSPCPVGGPNNDGATVKEFRWIGPGSSDLNDPSAAAWVDLGLPGAAATPTKTSPDETLTYTNGATGARWSGTTLFAMSESAASPTYTTAYARAGLSGVHLPGVTSTYGAPPCSVIGAGVAASSGWACDPTLWAGAVKVGDTYNLRDVDCYDTTLAPC